MSAQGRESESRAPTSSKERCLRTAEFFVNVVSELTEEQCAALESTGVPKSLRAVLIAVRAGQIAEKMTLGELMELVRKIAQSGQAES
jgi:hypothetical protein